LGSEVHGLLEGWLTDGAPVPDTRAGKIAKAGLEFLPAPGECDHVETQLLFDWEGLLFRGFVDVAWTGEDGVPVVSDHKTSSDPKKWGLSEAALPLDVQALIYATWLLDMEEVPVVDLRWTYFRTRGKALAFPVDARITREDARQNFKERVEPNARSIMAAIEDHQKTGALADSLQANPSACGMYGGCHFAAFCERTQEETLTAIFGNKEKEKEKDMGLKELLAKKNGRKLPPPRAGVNAPEAPASNEVAREISKVVGTITGNPKTRKAKAREAAEAAAGETDPSEAAQKAEAAVADAVVAEAPKRSKAQERVLELLEDQNPRHFAKTKARATAIHPFVHGRTLNAMVKEGLIICLDEDDLRLVKMVGAGVTNETADKEVESYRAGGRETPVETLKSADPKGSNIMVADDRLTELGEALADAFLDALTRRLSK
jgi:hypothetical protein